MSRDQQYPPGFLHTFVLFLHLLLDGQQVFDTAKLAGFAGAVQDGGSEAAHDAQHAGHPKPLFGPPTIKLAYARHIHDKQMGSQAPGAEELVPQSHEAQLGGHNGLSGTLAADARHGTHITENEHGQRPVREGHDALEHCSAAKKSFHNEQTAGTAGDVAIRDGQAHVSGDATNAHGQGTAPHHLEMQDATHTGEAHKRLLPSQPETRTLVYIYDLPTPLVNCSRPDWASYIYGAEVRLPEVRNACMWEIYACPACLVNSQIYNDGWLSKP